MTTILFYAAWAVLLMSASFSLPVAIAISLDEPFARLSLHGLLGAFASGCVLLALAGRTPRPTPMASLSVMIAVWVVLPVVAAVPFADLFDLGYVDALFEAVSGLTTTGASVIDRVSDLPASLVVLRSQMQWLGGALSLLSILSVLAPLGIGGLSAQALPRASGRRSMLAVERAGDLVRTVALFYTTVTLASFLAFLLCGAEPIIALCLAMTAVSSGGFLPFDGALLDRVGPIGLLVFAAVLLLSATSIYWHRMVLNWQPNRLRRHRESYYVLFVAAGLAGILFLSLARVSAADTRGTQLAESIFNAASLVSTSGIESRPGVLTLLALPVVLFVMLAGGSAYSTSGGIKLYRLGGMFVQSSQELRRLVYPSGVMSARFGSQTFDVAMIRAIWSYFVASIVVIAVGAFLISPAAVNFEAALVATVSAFSGAGPVYEAGWAPPGEAAWPGWEAFDVPAKLVLVAVMLAGRVEVLAVVALFSLRYWRDRT